ncbi:MAG: hypothetical protein H6739_16570 [Alphaproteobacteria bacterium]|nr:hypothetical protein [Alphaproteobacteria bacterium]
MPVHIQAPQKIAPNTAFTLVVQVDGARAGRQVTVTLTQEGGPPPWFDPRPQEGVASPEGLTVVTFDHLALSGPGTATLSAVARGYYGGYYGSDVVLIEVAP